MEDGPQAQDQSTRKRKLTQAGRASRDMTSFQSLAGLGEASTNLFQNLDGDKSQLKPFKLRLQELLESETRFYAGLLLTTKDQLLNIEESNSPREQLIRALSNGGTEFEISVHSYIALGEVADAAKTNLDSLMQVFDSPIGSSHFNQAFLAWANKLPAFIDIISPATRLIEIYQNIDPTVRAEIARKFQDLDTKANAQMEGYFISITQRIARYQLLLRDIHRALQKVTVDQHHDFLFDTPEAFLQKLDAVIVSVQAAIQRAEDASKQCCDVDQTECAETDHPEQTSKPYLITRLGRLHINGPSEKQKKLLRLHHQEFDDLSDCESESPRKGF